MISGGGTVVKVWEHATTSDVEKDVYGDVMDGGSDNDSEDEADEDQDEEDSSDEEEKQEKPKKKRKRGRGKATNVGNGIMGFKGMD